MIFIKVKAFCFKMIKRYSHSFMHIYFDVLSAKKNSPIFSLMKKKLSLFFYNGLYETVVEKACYISKLPI